MRKLLALLFSLIMVAPAAAQQTKSQLTTEIGANFPDNTSGLITPSILRTTTTDFVNSWQQAPRINPQTGTTYTFVVGDYGQMVTFTNASPVSVTLPQGTGSFATWNVTACNQGVGQVTITPSIGTIGGQTSLVLLQNQCRTIVSDGTNYQLKELAIQPITCAASNWISALSLAGVPSCSQPAFSNISGTLPVTQGGTGLTSGTSGGIPYYSSATTIGASTALTQFGVVYGGGPGGAPASTAAGTSAQLLLGQSAAAPTWNSLTGDASISASGVWTNSKVNGVTYAASPGTNTVPIVTAPNTVTYESVPNVALANSTITLSAGTGVGLTAPGSMALGSTNTIGSTSDTPRFAGLGLGGAASTRALRIYGATSGFLDFDVPAVAGTGKITWPAGTIDFSSTGGASQVVQQGGLGSAFTVGQLAFSNISSTIAASQIGTTTITGQTVNNTPSAANDYFLYFSAADNAIRKCTVGSCSTAGVAGVSSLNGLTGGLSLAAGTGLSVVSGGTTITFSLTSGRQTLPTTQRFLTGSGTYTTPANVLWIELRLVGGGGGGAGSNGSTASNAGATCWNTSGAACTSPVYSAGGGNGGSSGGVATAGGTISGTGTCTIGTGGGGGGAGAGSAASVIGAVAGSGGSSTLAGAGGGGGNNATGQNAATNTGSGGGGGGSSAASSVNAGSGGGGGATCYVIINSPAASYTFAVGAGTTGTAAIGNGASGGNGADGIILVVEHYGS